MSRTVCFLFAVLALTAVGVRTEDRDRSQVQPTTPQQPTGQQPQTPPADAQQPTFRAGINFVRVDVIITDNKGNNISDLSAADFDIVEDGKPQKIETFKLVKLDGGVSQAVREPPREIRTDYDEEAEASRDDVRLFAIFLDDYHVRRGASMAARGQLSKFVATQIGPSDMIGVMYPLESTSSVRMTRNHSAVMRGLEQFLGRKYEYEPKNAIEERYAHYPTEIVERIRMQVSLSAIRALVYHMGSLKEGRKALIVVSEGYTYNVPPQMRSANSQLPGYGNPQFGNPNAGVGDPNEERYAWTQNLDLQSDMREIYDAANRNNVAIYTVDPRGLPGFEFDINENIGLQTDRQYLNDTQDSLRVLAENTDGRAIVNRNDLTAGMAQITKDSSAYYLIGYSSSQAPSDGKFHEIKVRVKRPGVQVRARKGYWALTASETARALAPKVEVPKPVENAINAATLRPSSAAVVRTWIGTTRGENGKTRVTFVWEPIPRTPGDLAAGRSEAPARVSLMAVGGDGAPYYRGKVEPSASASGNGSNGSAPSASSTLPASSATSSAASGGALAARGGRVSFDVNPGKMQLRISVEGASSSVLDTEMREVTVPDLTGTQPIIGTPSLFRARTLRDYQQLKTDAQAMPVASREFSRTDRVMMRIPVYGPGGSTPAVKVRLLNRAGGTMGDLPSAQTAQPGEHVVELQLSALAPGEYVVEIIATGEGGETKELVAFRVTG